MKKIGEIKDEFTAAKEADWQSMCNQYRGRFQKWCAETDFAVRKENKGTGNRETPHGTDDAV